MKPALAILLLALAALPGCDSYPRDIEGTGERVAATHRLRVGYGALDPAWRGMAERYVARIAASSRAVVVAEDGHSTEALLAELDADRLDLVMTEVAEDSPWLAEVAVIEPLAERRVGGRKLGLSAVARNGENRWIMALEGVARDLVGGP